MRVGREAFVQMVRLERRIATELGLVRIHRAVFIELGGGGGHVVLYVVTRVVIHLVIGRFVLLVRHTTLVVFVLELTVLVRSGPILNVPFELSLLMFVHDLVQIDAVYFAHVVDEKTARVELTLTQIAIRTSIGPIHRQMTRFASRRRSRLLIAIGPELRLLMWWLLLLLLVQLDAHVREDGLVRTRIVAIASMHHRVACVTYFAQLGLVVIRLVDKLFIVLFVNVHLVLSFFYVILIMSLVHLARNRCVA